MRKVFKLVKERNVLTGIISILKIKHIQKLYSFECVCVYVRSCSASFQTQETGHGLKAGGSRDAVVQPYVYNIWKLLSILYEDTKQRNIFS